MKILYEDNHCIAVVKPHGLLAQADEGKDPSLLEEVKEMIKVRDKKPGAVFLGLVHRLDRPVGGVMVFAKTSKGASRLSEAIREHRFEKIYWAIVEGAPPEAFGDVHQWLRKDRKNNIVHAVRADSPDALEAKLSYRVLRHTGKYSLVEIRPETGRPHQIRVAMKSLGCPIVGDTKYGAQSALGGSIALFARALTFPKPVGGESVTVKADPILSVFEG